MKFEMDHYESLTEELHYYHTLLSEMLDKIVLPVWNDFPVMFPTMHNVPVWFVDKYLQFEYRVVIPSLLDLKFALLH